jgi:aminodeoxyfutalosine deaminase
MAGGTSTPCTLTARWIFPVDQPPLERGTVTIDGARIVAVEPHGSRPPDLDLGDVAVLPGLVNAHTHLDLSGLRGKCPPTPDFTDWLRAVIRHRRSQTPEQVESDIRAGLAESRRFGTTLVGDIAARGQSWPVLRGASSWSVVFYEVLGLPIDRTEAAASEATAWFDSVGEAQNCRAGISPHAPFSTSQMLFDWAGNLASRLGIRLATHLGETEAEIELLENRSGPFVPFLAELGVWEPKGLAGPLSEYIRLCCRHTRNLLLVHCNYLARQAYIPHEGAVVYCPRTHAAFGHSPHPFRDFLARGVRVALGTDSLASNPDLDVLAEARFVHGKHPDVDGGTLLRMATLSGAEALGWADETGSLTPGKSADLVVLPLPAKTHADPHLLVLESSLPVRDVLWCGRWTQGPLALGEPPGSSRRG